MTESDEVWFIDLAPLTVICLLQEGESGGRREEKRRKGEWKGKKGKMGRGRPTENNEK